MFHAEKRRPKLKQSNLQLFCGMGLILNNIMSRKFMDMQLSKIVYFWIVELETYFYDHDQSIIISDCEICAFKIYLHNSFKIVA